MRPFVSCDRPVARGVFRKAETHTRLHTIVIPTTITLVIRTSYTVHPVLLVLCSACRLWVSGLCWFWGRTGCPQGGVRRSWGYTLQRGRRGLAGVGVGRAGVSVARRCVSKLPCTCFVLPWEFLPSRIVARRASIGHSEARRPSRPASGGRQEETWIWRTPRARAWRTTRGRSRR